MNTKLFILLIIFVSLAVLSAKNLKKSKKSTYFNGCSTSGCIVYDLSTQSSCTEKTSGPTGKDWGSLSRNLDYKYFGGRIIGYKIKWFNGSWSGWYVPGVNDIDWKYSSAKGLRRVWAYFGDHSFSYIICSN